MLNKKSKKPGLSQAVAQKALKILLIQLCFTGFIALLMSFKGWVFSYSVLLGGMIYLIPNAYVTNKVLIKASKSDQQQTASQVLATLYMNQMWKMVITGILFALVFVRIQPLSPFSLFGTYIAIQAIGWYLQISTKNKFIKL